MKVTRNVIYDLLPAYFANEVSDDTRLLVEQYFESDPQFRRMAERFQALVSEHQQAGPADADVIGTTERDVFNRTRKFIERQHRWRVGSVAYGLAAVFAAFMAFVRSEGGVTLQSPGIVIGLVFGAVSLGSFLAWRWPSIAVRIPHNTSQDKSL